MIFGHTSDRKDANHRFEDPDCGGRGCEYTWTTAETVHTPTEERIGKFFGTSNQLRNCWPANPGVALPAKKMALKRDFESKPCWF